jgi:probable F420-dependent oxidoreductase
MRFDLWLPTANPFATPEYLRAVCEGAEERGVNRIWVGEHVVLFDEYSSSYPYAADGRLPAGGGTGLLDPFVTLAFLAAHTSTVRLGTAMALLPQRNPVYTAKEVATLDWLSGGRVDLGVGVGWLREEFEALGVPWARRGQRTDEYLGVLRCLWEDDPSSYQGELVSLPSCRQHPKPLQRPVPVHIGGESDAALRRVARTANGWVPFNCRPDDLGSLVDSLDGHLAAEGRGRDDIEITVCPYFNQAAPEDLAAYAEAGADSIAILFFALDAEQVSATFESVLPLLEAARRV